MALSHIVAMSANRVIGQDGRLPWHIPEDFKIFKRVTMGHAMIMGRKTFDSIGRPLPGRLSIVVTRQAAWQGPDGVVVCHSLEAAIKHAVSAAAQWGEEIFIIGGGDLFRQTMDAVTTVYLSEVPQKILGDTFYPPLPAEIFSTEHEEASVGEVPFTWRILRRLERRIATTDDA